MAVATLPELIEREAHVELRRRRVEPWARRVFLLALVAVSALGLASVFGQEPDTKTARADAADLKLSAPAAVRGGLVYEVVVTVSAHRDLAAPELVFDPGWFEGLTINTVEPEPAEWAQRDGRNVLAYGRLAAGDRLEVHLQYQANPTALGRRDQDLALADGGVELVQIDHRATVFP